MLNVYAFLQPQGSSDGRAFVEHTVRSFLNPCETYVVILTQFTNIKNILTDYICAQY